MHKMSRLEVVMQSAKLIMGAFVIFLLIKIAYGI